jgi:hypothetical protein
MKGTSQGVWTFEGALNEAQGVGTGTLEYVPKESTPTVPERLDV